MAKESQGSPTFQGELARQGVSTRELLLYIYPLANRSVIHVTLLAGLKNIGKVKYRPVLRERYTRGRVGVSRRP